MLLRFSEFINESGASGALEYSVVKRLLASFDERAENSYYHWQAWVRPMVNKIELSCELGEFQIEPLRKEVRVKSNNAVVSVDAQLSFVLDTAQSKILDSSDDIDLLIELELIDFSELIIDIRSQVTVTLMYMDARSWEPSEIEADEFYNGDGEIIPKHIIKRISNVDNLQQLGTNVMEYAVVAVANSILEKNGYLANVE